MGLPQLWRAPQETRFGKRFKPGGGWSKLSA